MNEDSVAPPEHTVEVIGLAREELRAITRRASFSGNGAAVTAAFKRILAKVRLQPRECGDPLYRLRAMKMTMFQTIDHPLYIEYGVHDDQPVVVIRRARWMSGPSA